MVQNLKNVILIVILLSAFCSKAQNWDKKIQNLPVIDGVYQDGVKSDWLIQKPSETAKVFRNEDSNELILSNGIISRSFRLSPNAATISLKVLSKQEEHVRAVKPEAIISVNGFTVNVGGLTGQPNLAFLYPDWLDALKADPLSFQFKGLK